jgi:chemotaxis signal transduction protein
MALLEVLARQAGVAIQGAQYAALGVGGRPARTRSTAIAGHLVVRAGDRDVAFPLSAVEEVFRMAAMRAPLLGVAPDCLGIADYHGRLVATFDLGARLGLCEPRDPLTLFDGFLLLVSGRHGEAAYAVDALVELTETEAEALTSGAPAGLLSGAVRLADEQLAPVIDADALIEPAVRELAVQALAQFSKAAGASRA